MPVHRPRTPFFSVLAAVVLLILSAGCGVRGPDETTGGQEGESVATATGESRPESASDETDLAPDYQELADRYEEMLADMPDSKGPWRSRMHRMAGQMRHFAGMMGDGDRMGGEMMGMRHRGRMRAMHRGAMGAGGPAGMADWHRQMAELHQEWAGEQAAEGNRAFAQHLEEMAARHGTLAESFARGASADETGLGSGDGAELYAASCASCHGASGQGVADAFPPLAGSPRLVGPPDRAARIVLRGLRGPLEAAGETYHGVMPSFAGRLDDEQISAVLTFVRASWGNEAGPVTPRDVARTRQETEGRGPFTVEELETTGP